VNIAIMRAFARLRRMLSRKLDQMERKYDDQFKIVFDALRSLRESSAPIPPQRRIGLAPPKS
jgi:hypothetical protein